MKKQTQEKEVRVRGDGKMIESQGQKSAAAFARRKVADLQ